eukprot:gene22428-27062_t
MIDRSLIALVSTVIAQTMVIFPERVVPSAYRDVLWLLNFNFNKWLPMRCFTAGHFEGFLGSYYWEFCIYAGLPFTVSIAIGALCRWHLHRLNVDKVEAESLGRSTALELEIAAALDSTSHSRSRADSSKSEPDCSTVSTADGGADDGRRLSRCLGMDEVVNNVVLSLSKPVVEDGASQGDTHAEYINVLIQTFASVSLWILVFLHPVCATYMFELFSCQLVYLDSRQYWLVMDNQVECFTYMWWAFVAAALGVILVYVLGLPVLMVAVPWHLRQLKQVRRLDNGKMMYVLEQDLHRESQLFDMLNQDASGVGVTLNPLMVPALQRSAAEHFHVLNEFGERVEVEPQYRDEPGEVDGVRELETAHADPDRMIIWGSYLLPFKSELYAWAAYDMIRKLAQTSLVIVVRLISPSYMLLYSAVVSAVFLTVHAHFRPYRDPMVNFFQTVILLSQNLIVTVCIGEHYERQPEGSTAVGLCAILLQLALCIPVAWLFCVDLHERKVLESAWNKLPMLGNLQQTNPFHGFRSTRECGTGGVADRERSRDAEFDA